MTLPQGWIEAKLGELSSKIGSGATPRGGREVYGSEGTPLIRSMNVHFDGFRFDGLAFIDSSQAKALANVVVEANDVLLNITGASIGRVCLAPEDMAGGRVNQHVCIIRLDEVEQRYIQAFLAAPEMQRFVLEENYGLTRQALTKRMIEDIVVPLPPLAEQRRIVAKLDALTARIARARAELDRVPVLAEHLRTRFLADAFAGRTRSCEVPFSEWRKLPAAEACAKVQSGGTPKGGFANDGVPFLKVYNIVGQEVSFDHKPQYVSLGSHCGELKKSMAQPGDVLMNIVGPPLGKVGIVPAGMERCNFNQALTMFRPSDAVTSEWLYFFLCSGKSVASVIGETRGIAGQVNISLSQCRAFEIPIPPIDQQRRIVSDIKAAFARADRLEAEATRARALLDRLESALLAKAFRGELVPQDPNDEPAQTLLDRIRQQRAAETTAKRGRKAKVTA